MGNGKRLAALAVAAAGLLAMSAHAGGASIHLHIGTGGYQPYVYSQPQVYVQPGTRYVQPAYVYTQPRYVQPAYVYTQPRYVQPTYMYTQPSYIEYGQHRYYGGQNRHNPRWNRSRDLDRDGIPDRYDRDRDGDGVPNRFDRYPDNPYRR